MNKLFTLILILVPAICFSQIDIRKELIAYTDSSEVLIKNGRKLMAENITFGKHKEAINILNFLKKEIAPEYVILYPSEEILFSISTRSFELFLYNAKNFSSLLEEKTKRPIYENISAELHSYLANEISFIIDDLVNSRLPENEKELISIYLSYYNNEDYFEINKRIRKFNKENPGNDYKNFLSTLKKEVVKSSMNINLAYGNTYLSGPIANIADNKFNTFWMEFDGFINKLYLSMYLNANTNKMYAAQDIPLLKKNLIHKRGEEVSSLKYGFKIGKIIWAKKKVNIYPYITFGGFEMISQSPEFKPADSNETVKNKLTGSFFTGIGISSDIIIKKWVSKSFYEPSGQVFIRPIIGYDQFITNHETAKGHSLSFSIALGIGFGRL